MLASCCLALFFCLLLLLLLFFISSPPEITTAIHNKNGHILYRISSMYFCLASPILSVDAVFQSQSSLAEFLGLSLPPAGDMNVDGLQSADATEYDEMMLALRNPTDLCRSWRCVPWGCAVHWKLGKKLQIEMNTRPSCTVAKHPPHPDHLIREQKSCIF